MKIESLELSTSITNKLKDKKILFVEDLWKLNRENLKKIGFDNYEINDIIIKLQLKGLDLNKKKYTY